MASFLPAGAGNSPIKVGVGDTDRMGDAAIYERVVGIRAQLLDLIGEIESGDSAPGRAGLVVQDELMMVANRLGRVAAVLQRSSGSTAPTERG